MSDFAALLSGSVRAELGGTFIEERGGARIISEQHDAGRINWAAGLSDPGEMIRCGYMPEARRLAGESDQAYMQRLLSMDMPAILGPDRFSKLLQAAQQRAGLATGSDGRINMFSALVPPWHGLGTLVDQAATSAEALALAGLAGWGLEKLPLFAKCGDQWVEAPEIFAIVRRDTRAVLGTVGSRYKIMSNEDSFSFMDAVVDGVSTRYETAGTLGRGERVWILAAMPGASGEVAGGDEVKSYIFFGTSHDGSQAVTCFQTSLRTECANTYRQAMKGRGRIGGAISIRHTTNLDSAVESARDALGLAAKTAQDFLATGRELAAQPMPDPRPLFHLAADEILDTEVNGLPVTGAALADGSLFKSLLDLKPDKREAAQKALDKATNRRNSLFEELLAKYDNPRNNGKAAIAGSAWAAVNAISETVEHGAALRYKGSDRERAENRFDSVLTGRAAEIVQNAIGYAQQSA